jgi:hypothetical protein
MKRKAQVLDLNLTLGYAPCVYRNADVECYWTGTYSPRHALATTSYTANEGLVKIQYKCLIWNLIHSQTK